MDYSVITCDEIIEVGKTNFNEKNITCKTQNFFILLGFLLITISLLIAVSVYYHLMKYLTKQKTFITILRRKIKAGLH